MYQGPVAWGRQAAARSGYLFFSSNDRSSNSSSMSCTPTTSLVPSAARPRRERRDPRRSRPTGTSSLTRPLHPHRPHTNGCLRVRSATSLPSPLGAAGTTLIDPQRAHTATAWILQKRSVSAQPLAQKSTGLPRVRRMLHTPSHRSRSHGVSWSPFETGRILHNPVARPLV